MWELWLVKKKRKKKGSKKRKFANYFVVRHTVNLIDRFDN